MKTIFIPTLAFLVLASGLATAKEPVCYDSKGNVAHCNTTVKRLKKQQLRAGAEAHTQTRACGGGDSLGHGDLSKPAQAL